MELDFAGLLILLPPPIRNAWVLKTKRSEFFRNRRGVVNSRETRLGPAAKKDEEAKKKEFTRVERQAWVK